MDTGKEILLVLDRINHELLEIRKSSRRVSALEAWSSRLKSMWAAFLRACGYLKRTASGKLTFSLPKREG